LLADPAAVLSAAGAELPAGVTLQVQEAVDSKAWLVLPSASASASDSTMTLGDLGESINSSFSSLSKLIAAGSYLAGLGFSIGAIMKFKQHKDNPTQIPIGTPIALVIIAAALLFIPEIVEATGTTA
jgi:intracellular multiplication protein IcmD